MPNAQTIARVARAIVLDKVLFDADPRPMTDAEWERANDLFPGRVKSYYRGIITGVELARLVRAY